MISKETMMVGIVAVVAGLAAAYGVRSYMTQPEATPPAPVVKPAPPKPLRVPVASEDLPADRVVAPGDIVTLTLTPQSPKQVRARFKGLPPDQILASARSIVRRRLKKPVKQGQPFLTTDFYLEGVSPPITSKLQPGFRAIRVEVPDDREGGVQPGVYVDVLFRAKPRKAQAGQPAIPEMTVTLLRSLEVLEVDHPKTGRRSGVRGESPPDVPKKSVLVTLAVPAEKADVFGVVDGAGELWLAPTPGRDKQAAGGAEAPLPRPLTLAALLGVKPPKPKPIPLAPTPPPPPFETAIYRRDNMHINKFVDGKLLVGHIPRQPTSRAQQKSKRSVPEAQATPPEARTEEKED
jgi:pilus assembly protein CpaB